MSSRVNAVEDVEVGGVEVIGRANREHTGADVGRPAGTELAGAGVAKNNTKQE